MPAVESVTKFPDIHDLISTAHHEAGHAVYGLAMGMQIPKVLIFRNHDLGAMEGLTYYTYPVAELIKNKKVKNFILCSEIGFHYAGLLSEKQFWKMATGSDKFPLFLRNGSSDDTLTAAAIIRKHNLAPAGKERYTFKTKQIKKTYKFITKYWGDISLIAHALFQKKKLSFEEMSEILTKKSKYKTFWKNQFKLLSVIYTDPEIDYNVLKNTLCL